MKDCDMRKNKDEKYPKIWCLSHLFDIFKQSDPFLGDSRDIWGPHLCGRVSQLSHRLVGASCSQKVGVGYANINSCHGFGIFLSAFVVGFKSSN